MQRGERWRIFSGLLAIQDTIHMKAIKDTIHMKAIQDTIYMKAIQGTILDNLPLNVSEVIKIAAVTNSCIQAQNDSTDLCSAVQPALAHYSMV